MAFTGFFGEQWSAWPLVLISAVLCVSAVLRFLVQLWKVRRNMGRYQKEQLVRMVGALIELESNAHHG